MRLTDIMQEAGLAFWAQVAFVLFGVAFLAVVVRVIFTKRSFTERMSAMPLSGDDEPGDLEDGFEGGAERGVAGPKG